MLVVFKQELRDCFNTFDSDKSGFISITELRKVCETLSLSVNERELKDLMKLMDKVSFNHFKPFQQTHLHLKNFIPRMEVVK